MADQDIKMLIERIMAEARTHQSARFSHEVYADEPILKTGRQMQNFLPDQYRKMREISRWQDDPKGGAGRWLSEAELFYRQGLLMADFEDDCPCNGTFKSYFPTYNAMSDRQLRGYFTWRAQVRRGTVEETSTSFAFLYLYELICGIGVDDPLDGFSKIKAFWDAYRAFEPGIDRFARVWLQDYAVFHRLDPKLLRDSKTVMFDNALIELRRAARDLVPAQAPSGQTPKRRKTSEPTLPLPPDEAREERLMAAINALSTYNLSNSRLDRSHPICAMGHAPCRSAWRTTMTRTERPVSWRACLGRRQPCPIPCLPRLCSLRLIATRIANTVWTPSIFTVVKTAFGNACASTAAGKKAASLVR